MPQHRALELNDLISLGYVANYPPESHHIFFD